MEIQYNPPKFDPFIEFNPTKSFIKSIIKELKEQSYAAQRQKLKAEERLGYIPQWLTDRHAWLNDRIRCLTDRCNSWSREHTWDLYRGQGVSEQDVRRAKEVPITNLYDGRLRKRGRTMVGLCPFHTEKTASFTIYPDRNIYRCFGCNTYGDSIDFITLRDQVDFKTAVIYLINNV